MKVRSRESRHTRGTTSGIGDREYREPFCNGRPQPSIIAVPRSNAAASIRAFTLSFDRDDYNEEAYAKEMANRAGAEFMTIPIRRDDLADHFAAEIEHAELLATNTHGVAKYVLSRALRDAGCKVVLTKVRTRFSEDTHTFGATCNLFGRVLWRRAKTTSVCRLHPTTRHPH